MASFLSRVAAKADPRFLLKGYPSNCVDKDAGFEHGSLQQLDNETRELM